MGTINFNEYFEESPFWEKANPQMPRTSKAAYLENAIDTVEVLLDEFGFTVETVDENSRFKPYMKYCSSDVDLTTRLYYGEGTEMTKKPEIEIVEINLPEPADPDSYERAMATAKRRPGKFGVLSVTGDQAGYIESQEMPVEEIIRDDKFYLERMEAIVEKAEEELVFEAEQHSLNVDIDLLRTKDGKFVLFEMYAEILHARTAFNMNEDYRGMTAMEGVPTPIGDYLDEKKIVE